MLEKLLMGAKVWNHGNTANNNMHTIKITTILAETKRLTRKVIRAWESFNLGMYIFKIFSNPSCVNRLKNMQKLINQVYSPYSVLPKLRLITTVSIKFSRNWTFLPTWFQSALSRNRFEILFFGWEVFNLAPDNRSDPGYYYFIQSWNSANRQSI